MEAVQVHAHQKLFGSLFIHCDIETAQDLSKTAVTRLEAV